MEGEWRARRRAQPISAFDLEEQKRTRSSATCGAGARPIDNETVTARIESLVRQGLASSRAGTNPDASESRALDRERVSRRTRPVAWIAFSLKDSLRYGRPDDDHCRFACARGI
jgi:hypothetical protein